MNQFSNALKIPLTFFIPFLILMIALLPACAALRDTDPDRGAATVKQDVFGDHFTTVEYLPQNWAPADSLWFYTVTQGSNMMPYDFFLTLEQVGKTEPFRSNENMNFYRYLPQKATSSNPDGLPVGFVKDTYKGKDYIGVTCAACHTAQLNYQGKGIRIDGGPAIADMEGFMRDLVKALRITQNDDEVKKRFVQNVLAKGRYKTEAEVLADLDGYEKRLANYITINYSTTHYGYGRLDAFGRIYNRVLEHIISVKELNELLRDPRIMGDRALTEAQLKSMTDKTSSVLSGAQRDQLSQDIVTQLTEDKGGKELGTLRKKIFNPANAPVSYPFLWDTPQHDYVQWNGLTENAGLKAIARNAGEAIGVFGTLDWTERDGFSLPSLITGQGLFGKHISFDSSVNVMNLRRIEARLWNLQSPEWPQDILGHFDEKRLTNGRSLFNKHCVSCHARIVRNDPDRRVVAHMSSASDAGTDTQMAHNAVTYQGFSGILRNQYVNLGVGDVLLDRKAAVAALLTKATVGVVATPEPDKWFLQRWAEWAYNLATGFRDNQIKASMKQGDYDPDTTANPVASLSAYKARPLNGIWATAPYLHNGSVPTLYDLLLPKKRPGDPEDGEYRPDEFEVGSREFDPIKVGLKSSGYGGFIFSTKGIKDDMGGYTKGNSNAGHEYGARRVANEADGRVDPKIRELCANEQIKDTDLDASIKEKCLGPMSRQDRFDLLEYLKTL
ncbi:MAG: di-heme-cytochrome C peroxidase [Nitrosospira sp.]